MRCVTTTLQRRSSVGLLCYLLLNSRALIPCDNAEPRHFVNQMERVFGRDIIFAYNLKVE
jgi:hypothetical protein